MVLRTLLLLMMLAAGAMARQIPITLLHTTDLHGHLLPPLEKPYATRGGSLLRCATLIEDIRSKTPHVLLVDCGDALQGSAESWLTQGRAVLQAMEWLRYDAWVLGNHDFDWGVSNLSAQIERTSVPVLAANLRMPDGEPNPLDRVQPYVIKEVDGVRVALVGLTTPGISRWLDEGVLGPLQVERSEAALSRLMPQLRQAQPDVLILLVHQGYQKTGDDFANEVNRIARRFPEFDVILGGHLHWVVPGMRLGPVLYSQAGSYGQGLGRVDLVYDTVLRRVVEKTSEVLEVDTRYEESAELRAVLQQDLDRAMHLLDEVVGACAVPLKASVRIPGQSAIQQLLCASIASAVQADVVLHGLLSTESLEEGPIRQRDVWRMVPYENRIGVLLLTPREIKEVLEQAAEYSGSTHFLGSHGLAYDFCPSAPQGKRIHNLRLPNGDKIHPRKRLRVAFNSHTLNSAGGRYDLVRRLAARPETRLDMTGVDTRSAVVEYIRAHRPLKITAGNDVKVIRNLEK